MYSISYLGCTQLLGLSFVSENRQRKRMYHFSGNYKGRRTWSSGLSFPLTAVLVSLQHKGQGQKLFLCPQRGTLNLHFSTKFRTFTHHKEDNWLYGRDYEFSTFAIPLRMTDKAVLHSQGKTRRELKADLSLYYNPNTQQWVFKRQQSLGKETNTQLICPRQSTAVFLKSLHMRLPRLSGTP